MIFVQFIFLLLINQMIFLWSIVPFDAQFIWKLFKNWFANFLLCESWRYLKNGFENKFFKIKARGRHKSRVSFSYVRFGNKFFDFDIENRKAIKYIENKPMIPHLIPTIIYILYYRRINLLVLSTLKLAARFIVTSVGKL